MERAEAMILDTKIESCGYTVFMEDRPHIQSPCGADAYGVRVGRANGYTALHFYCAEHEHASKDAMKNQLASFEERD